MDASWDPDWDQIIFPIAIDDENVHERGRRSKSDPFKSSFTRTGAKLRRGNTVAVDVVRASGHEQPFAIQLSHEREALEVDPNAKCEFILREAKKQMKIADRKQSKSKKKTLAGLFRRSSGKLSTSLRSNSFTEGGTIFGYPLGQICDPDLPPPLLELLQKLYNVGPFTTEIFRKPSNARKCQEMVHHMNSSDWHGWAENCNNGILFASILKTFLKELPDKVLCQELYNQWSDSVKITDENDRIEKCKSHIQSKSDDNLMTSYNLAVCLGPSLLWTSSESLSDQEESSRTVPQVLQFLIDNCQAILGHDVLQVFGHPPVAPVDDEEGMQTACNNSLESLSDTEAPVGALLQQMSPSSCSRDSGLILSDPHEDGGEQSDEMSLRQQLIKSKSCDSLAVSESSRRHSAALTTLQSQVSSDSLDCDDEYVDVGTSFNSSLLLTKSTSGAHLLFNQHQTGSERLRSSLDALAARYTDASPALPEVGYSSSDSDKPAANHRTGRRSSESASPRYFTATIYSGADLSPRSVQKSSTNSSLGHRGSTSSDDAIPSVSYEKVTYRRIDEPKFHESESGFHPKDLLQQFQRKEQKQEKTIPEHSGRSAADILQKSTTPLNTNYQHKVYSQSDRHADMRITRTNTYAGRSERSRNRQKANMAETHPIMPQQYRPNKPPTYQEAVERKQLIYSNISESERLKQTVNSARAKQLYNRSVLQFEREQQIGQRTAECSASDSDSLHMDNPKLASQYQSNNTIGIVKTGNKKIIIKRALPSRTGSLNSRTKSTNQNMFYQPHLVDTNIDTSLADSFYRPSYPPPYKEVMRRRSKPDLIDAMEESLV